MIEEVEAVCSSQRNHFAATNTVLNAFSHYCSLSKIRQLASHGLLPLISIIINRMKSAIIKHFTCGLLVRQLKVHVRHVLYCSLQ